MTLTRAWLGILSGTVAFGLAGLAYANTEDTLEDRVEARLKSDAQLDKLDVDVKDGVVTLKGEVANRAQRARAEKLARAAGAKQVVNQVEIDADKAIALLKEAAGAKKARIDERAQREKDAIDRQTERAAVRLEQAGSAGTSTAVKPAVVVTGEPRKTDQVVLEPMSARVRSRLIREDGLSRSEIHVDTGSDGVVTLKGTVPSAQAEARAIEIARTTDGVRKVVDEIEVKDPGISLKVRSRFNDESALAKSEINVSTDDEGVVTLIGTAPSAQAEARAIEITRTTDGVRKVVDKIEVKAPVVK